MSADLRDTARFMALEDFAQQTEHALKRRDQFREAMALALEWAADKCEASTSLADLIPGELRAEAARLRGEA